MLGPLAWRTGPCRRKSSAEIRAAELLTEVEPIELRDSTHLVQPGAHALSDAVAQRLLARCGPDGGKRVTRPSRALILEVGGDDRGAIVVVAGVEDEAHR